MNKNTQPRPNYRKLQAKLKENGITQNEIAKELKMSHQRFSDIVNGKGEFRFSHIIKMARILNLEKSDLGDIFLSQRRF